MRKIIIIIVISAFVATVGIYSFNYFQLQHQMKKVIEEDSRNNGIKVSVHFGNYVNPSILVYDLKSISGTNSMADVFRVLLQFAEKMQSREFDTVDLASKGETKFKINGDYFQKLGREYSFQNPVYTMNHFPENLMNPDGSKAYTQWTGGWIGVVAKQIEDFNDFHKKWYLQDITR